MLAKSILFHTRSCPLLLVACCVSILAYDRCNTLGFVQHFAKPSGACNQASHFPLCKLRSTVTSSLRTLRISISDSGCQTKVPPDGYLLSSSSLVLQVRWWDVTVGKQDFRLDGHSDYVRSAAVSPTSPDMWATAGYDHICKLWDVRSQECTMSLDHGAPIEDVKFFPSGDYHAQCWSHALALVSTCNTWLALVIDSCMPAVHLCSLRSCKTGLVLQTQRGVFSNRQSESDICCFLFQGNTWQTAGLACTSLPADTDTQCCFHHASTQAAWFSRETKPYRNCCACAYPWCRWVGCDSWRHITLCMGYDGGWAPFAAALSASENCHLCCVESPGRPRLCSCSSHAVWLPGRSCQGVYPLLSYNTTL